MLKHILYNVELELSLCPGGDTQVESITTLSRDLGSTHMKLNVGRNRPLELPNSGKTPISNQIANSAQLLYTIIYKQRNTSLHC